MKCDDREKTREEKIIEARAIIESRIVDCANMQSLSKINHADCFNALRKLCFQLKESAAKITPTFDLLETNTNIQGQLFPINSFKDEKKGFFRNRCEEENKNNYASGIIESGYQRCLKAKKNRHCMKGLADACKARKILPNDISIRD